METLEYKVPDGKLLQAKVKIEEETIKDIEITGDFFIHPEESIKDIEESLKGKKTDEVEKRIEDFIESKDIEIVGFKPKDVEEMIKKKY